MILSLPLAVTDAFWALSPFITALLVRVILKESISTATLIAMVLSFFTAMSLTILESKEEVPIDEESNSPSYVTAVIFSLLCVLSASIYQIVTRKL